MRKRVFADFIAALFLVLPLPVMAACKGGETAERLFRVVLGETEHISCETPVAEVRAGEDAVFRLVFAEGYAFGGADCEDYVFSEEESVLTVPNVRYSRYVELKAEEREKLFTVTLAGTDCETPVKKCAAGAQVTFVFSGEGNGTDYAGRYELTVGEPSSLTLYGIEEDTEVHITEKVTPQEGLRGILYDANGGLFYGNGVRKTVVMPWEKRRLNTLNAAAVAREGYTLAGWNTRADGGGERIGAGSRAVADPFSVLYAEWKPWTPADRFTFRETEGGITVTGYAGGDSEVVVPASVGGMPVIGIETGAFAALPSLTSVLLPVGLSYVGEAAFSELSSLRSFSLFDDLVLSKNAFRGCSPAQITIGAVLPPLYGTKENGQLANKLELLFEGMGRKKLLFFGGCSVWYGVDSALAEEAFPGFSAFNMGVIGGTVATFQMDLICRFLEKGDVFVHLPELISPYQLLYDVSFDQRVFMTLEANYDLVSYLDMTRYTFVVPALSDFLAAKRALFEEGETHEYQEGMPEMDGRGDLRREREGGYDNEGQPYTFLDPSLLTNNHAEISFARQYGMIADKGVSVYVGVAPFNADGAFLLAGEELVRAMARFIEMGNAPACVFMTAADAAMDKSLVYDTNWHLSDEGARVYTERVVARLKEHLI